MATPLSTRPGVQVCYQSLGSCSRAARWSAATLCFGTKLPFRDVPNTVATGGVNRTLSG